MLKKYKRKIFGFECDIYGHLNNAAYLRLYEEARSIVLEDIGYSIARFKDLGIALYLIRLELDLKKEVPLGSTVQIRTEILNTSRVKFKWYQEMINESDQLCSKLMVTGVFVKNGKPWRIPFEIMAAFQAVQT